MGAEIVMWPLYNLFNYCASLQPFWPFVCPFFWGRLFKACKICSYFTFTSFERIWPASKEW
jgi:hypothetical protein